MAQYSNNLREEEVKNKLREDYFSAYDATPILGNVDFAVAKPAPDSTDNKDKEYLVWAESKNGTKHDIYESLVQLILTIGKARTFETYISPTYLCAFDAKRIAFIEYNDVQHVFAQNDFNWNVTPSDHSSKEFLQLSVLVKDSLDKGLRTFSFDGDDKELRLFIGRLKTKKGKGIQISKNNFVHIFQKWLKEVKPSINIDWDKAKQAGLYDADFYRADIMSDGGNKSVVEKLQVVLDNDRYVLDRHIDDLGADSFSMVGFHDSQVAHRQFWNKYTRPPKEEYWNYIIDRRDLLVPQDAREYSGAFYTPQKLVGLSQQYIEEWLGEDWQDAYYVWDCCAGSGNLLVGLTNKYNIYASTKDESDIGIIRQRFAEGGNETLLSSHVFRFDFLNGKFTDKGFPDKLRTVIDDPDKRKRLIIYINPPYAEGDSRIGKGRSGVAADSDVYANYGSFMGYAKREKYIQFLTRIYRELPGCKLCFFSKLKNLQAPKFKDFRRNFRASLERVFVVPSDAFDNVDGQFPISFQMWDTACEKDNSGIIADVYDAGANLIGRKTLISYDGRRLINDWTLNFVEDKMVTSTNFSLGTIIGIANDFQNQTTVRIERPHKPWNHQYQWQITRNNLIESCIYFAVRLCVPANWINDRDQFLAPLEDWRRDCEFQSDCLAYVLFHGQNRISSTEDVNHWIPFSEEEVNAKDKYQSDFMYEFIQGKVKRPQSEQSFNDDFGNAAIRVIDGSQPIAFSAQAKAVMDAGRELWRYYHSQPLANPDASFYDIRFHFQGTKVTAKGKVQMNPDSQDERYTALIQEIRTRLKVLSKAIEPKVYKYGFLKE